MNIQEWHTYSLPYQMGNIGAEASRMLALKEKNNPAHAERAFERALELLDMTIMDSRRKGQLSELTRLREILCACMVESPEYSISAADVNNYFLPFAVMARMRQEPTLRT